MELVKQKVVTQGKVCADPDRPCPGFKANELSFSIATPFKFDRGRDKSQPFYAVIPKSAPICSLADAGRTRAQKTFPRAKVFLHRYFCEDFGVASILTSSQEPAIDVERRGEANQDDVGIVRRERSFPIGALAA
jgi:hypothetical protein